MFIFFVFIGVNLFVCFPVLYMYFILTEIFNKPIIQYYVISYYAKLPHLINKPLSYASMRNIKRITLAECIVSKLVFN